MRQDRRIAVLVMLLMLASVSCMAQEKVTLLFRAKPGQVARYKTTGSIEVDAGGAKIKAELTEVTKVTIKEVASSGNVTLERKTESNQISMNGHTESAPDSEMTTDTIVVRPDGSLLSYQSTGKKEMTQLAARMYAASYPFFPNKALTIGDKWNHEVQTDEDLGARAGNADFTLLGIEPMVGSDTAKIKMVYAEKSGDHPLSSEGTLWVEKSSGDLVASDLKLDNLPFGEGASVSGTIHTERTEGSLLGDVKTGGAASAGSEPKEKTIDDTVKGYEKLPGLFTMYRKSEPGRDSIYMEIKESQLDKLMMMEVTARTGTAAQVVSGNPINDLLFKFARTGDGRIMLVTPNIGFRAVAGSPMDRAVRNSFADAYLQVFKIEAKQPDRKSLLIDVSDLFKGDIAQISDLFQSPLGGMFGGGASYSLDREKTYVSMLKSFAENLTVETSYHFSSSGSGGLAGLIARLMNGDTLADARSIPFIVNYTIFALNDNGYRPRLADPRVGYFQTEYQSFDNDASPDPKVRYIYRWNLEKADPKLPLSPPKQPIVFWLDNAIPLEYRDAVREGLLYWNNAFEKVGFKDAIVVKQMPDNADWDTADMRYNTIRWVASPSSGYAVALFRVNPITGQILNANITVDANLVHFEKQTHRTLVDPSSYFQQPASPLTQAIDPRRCDMAAEAMEQAWFGQMAIEMAAPAGAKVDPKEYTHAFLRMVVSHEMGHIMGLRHNFIASTYHSLDELKDESVIHHTGISASVMDYIPWNISALKANGVDFFQPCLGPYDLWAIQYGYTPIDATTPTGELYVLRQIASRCNEPGHAYESDEIADQFDPAVTRFDLGSDPLAYWKRTLDLSRFLMLHLGEREPKRGESYWEFTRDFNMLMGQYTRAAAIASRYIGGLHVGRNHKGDPGERPTLVPIPGDQQKQALAMLDTYIFSAGALQLPQNYYTRLTSDPNADLLSSILNGGQDFPIFDSLSRIQQSALRYVFSPGVLDRVVNNEFKVHDPQNALTLPALFRTVGGTVWSELDSGTEINALHRQLQRTHLDLLITMVVTPNSSTPADARMLAWDQLRQLRTKIRAAQRQTHDDYTRVHLDESLMHIDRALNAQQVLSSAQTSARSPLELLLGGQQPAPK